MMVRRPTVLLVAMAALAACGRHRPSTGPAPLTAQATRTVDSLWARAVSAFGEGQWNDAQKALDRLSVVLTPGDPRYLRSHFFQGEILFAQGNQLQAVREFRRVADEQPEGPLAPDALLRAGDAYADLWRRPELDPTYGETARGVYQEVVSRYGGTSAAARAAVRLNQLSEKFAEKEYKNALFYFRFKAWDSAILMLRGVIATYPRAAVVPDALERLVRVYQILGYKEDMKETCAYIAQYHPDAEGPVRLCPKEAGAPGSAPGEERP